MRKIILILLIITACLFPAFSAEDVEGELSVQIIAHASVQYPSFLISKYDDFGSSFFYFDEETKEANAYFKVSQTNIVTGYFGNVVVGVKAKVKTHDNVTEEDVSVIPFFLNENNGIGSSLDKNNFVIRYNGETTDSADVGLFLVRWKAIKETDAENSLTFVELSCEIN